jgi:hypothetical protein
MKKIFILSILTLSLNTMNAQISMPQPSPLGTITQKVGLNDVTIVYSRPSAKDRKVFGDLVPYGELWRTGANRSVKFTVSDSTTVGGKKIGKGDYSLFTIPNEKEWTIVINKAVDLSGTNGYKQEEDVVRFNVPVQKTAKTETFTFNFANLTNTSADVEIMWDEVKVAFKIEVTVDDKVMKNIDAALNPSANTYFSAARYYYETERDSKQALEWVNKSLSIGGDKYWILRTKSLIQARMADYKGAIETATKSKELAAKDEDGTYVKMNETSIAEWTKQLNDNNGKGKTR